MPYLPVKIKEEIMSLRKELDELETAIHDVSQGVNAIGAMTLGLMQARDPYADGFNALYSYLLEADREVHKRLAVCLTTV